MDLEGLSPPQRIKKFDDAHGDFVVVDGWILYEDGAQREVNPWGAMCEPPLDDCKCSKIILNFCEAKMNLAREEFQVHKQNLTTQCRVIAEQGNCNRPTQPPSKEAVEKLKELRKKVLCWQKRLNKAREAVENNKPERLTVRDVACEQNRQKAANAMAEIEEIKI